MAVPVTLKFNTKVSAVEPGLKNVNAAWEQSSTIVVSPFNVFDTMETALEVKLNASKNTPESRLPSEPSAIANLIWYVWPQVTAETAVKTVVKPFKATLPWLVLLI